MCVCERERDGQIDEQHIDMNIFFSHGTIGLLNADAECHGLDQFISDKHACTDQTNANRVE